MVIINNFDHFYPVRFNAL